MNDWVIELDVGGCGDADRTTLTILFFFNGISKALASKDVLLDGGFGVFEQTTTNVVLQQ